jgi:hypothetical protein
MRAGGGARSPTGRASLPLVRLGEGRWRLHGGGFDRAALAFPYLQCCPQVWGNGAPARDRRRWPQGPLHLPARDRGREAGGAAGGALLKPRPDRVRTGKKLERLRGEDIPPSVSRGSAWRGSAARIDDVSAGPDRAAKSGTRPARLRSRPRGRKVVGLAPFPPGAAMADRVASSVRLIFAAVVVACALERGRRLRCIRGPPAAPGSHQRDRGPGHPGGHPPPRHPGRAGR